MIPLKSFSEIDGGRSLQRQSRMRVGFVDAEGQGDRDVTYDAVSSLHFLVSIFISSFSTAFSLSHFVDFEMCVIELDG
jgi:hypothetical protein